MWTARVLRAVHTDEEHPGRGAVRYAADMEGMLSPPLFVAVVMLINHAMPRRIYGQQTG